MSIITQRSARAGLALVCTLLALAGPDVSGPLAAWCTYLCLNLFPGLALGLALDRRPASGRLALWALMGSPALCAALSALAMLAGLDAATTGRLLMAVFGAGATIVIQRRSTPQTDLSGRELGIVCAVAAAAILLIAYLPLTDEWWRIRSDAWFHGAVVAEINDFGIPPSDPYFVGFALQYMWFYHVLVLVLARSCATDPFWIMAILNAHALAGLFVAAFATAGVFERRFGHRLASAATVLFGFNGLYWLFFPLKGLKALTGDVRGWEEISRLFSLSPLNYKTVTAFMNIYYNAEFFLDKYMVATAFGLALSFLMTAWYSASASFREGRSATLGLLFVALVGMLGFHSLVGFVTLVGIFGGGILMHLQLRRSDGYRGARILAVLAVSAAAFLLMTPYLYTVMHLKESEQVIPISFSLKKTIGISISSALVAVLAFKQRRRVLGATPHERFYIFAFCCVTLFCLSIRLPGPNTYDKLGYFPFMPLAVVAGWTLADAARASRLQTMALVALCFLPVNAVAFAGACATPPTVLVDDVDRAVTRWARANTGRSDVFIDNDDRVTLLVTGPRRYYWGRIGYADQWGYNRTEMSRRYHTRDALYASQPLDGTALASLAAIEQDTYVIVRDPRGAGADAAVRNESGLFSEVYNDGVVAVMKVDPTACRDAAAVRPQISEEELHRESGL